MTALEICFHEKRLFGRGTDIIGDFELEGIVNENGEAVITKQYLGRHAVLYVGTYDGEGTFSGHWQLGPYRGRWLISLNRDADYSGSEIAEILPISV